MSISLIFEHIRKTIPIVFLIVAALVPGFLCAQPSDGIAKALPRVGDLLVSEVLFNPKPEGADYVELYNASDTALMLDSVCLVRWNNDALQKFYPLPAGCVVAPHDYVVFTTDASSVKSCYSVSYTGKLWELPAMPPYNDASGTVIVALHDSTILDRFDYTEKMHSRILHDVEGVALERRSFSVATQTPANWYSAASTAGFGTPTYRNSQSAEMLFVDNDFLFSPTIFSPDDDGYNDHLDITYRLASPCLIGNITLYDASGHTVRHLLRNAVLGTEGIASWDGIDDNGARCLRGDYIVLVEAFNENGQQQCTRKTITLIR